MAHIDKLQGLVDAQRDMIDSLADQVRILEGRVSRRLRRSGGSSCSSGPSTGGSSYGTPGESIHQPVAEPKQLEGMVGDGSRKHPYTHVVVDWTRDVCCYGIR